MNYFIVKFELDANGMFFVKDGICYVKANELEILSEIKIDNFISQVNERSNQPSIIDIKKYLEMSVMFSEKESDSDLQEQFDGWMYEHALIYIKTELLKEKARRLRLK